MLYQVMPYSEAFEYHDNARGVLTFPQLRSSTQGLDLMQRMLAANAKNRISAKDALRHEWFILMKVEEKLTKKRKTQNQILPTILEKSDLFTMSPGGQNPKNESIGVFEDEFVLDSLAERMANMENKFNPSKQNHVVTQRQIQYPY